MDERELEFKLLQAVRLLQEAVRLQNHVAYDDYQQLTCVGCHTFLDTGVHSENCKAEKWLMQTNKLLKELEEEDE